MDSAIGFLILSFLFFPISQKMHEMLTACHMPVGKSLYSYTYRGAIFVVLYCGQSLPELLLQQLNILCVGQ